MAKIKNFYRQHIEKDLGLYFVIGSELCNSWMLVATKLLENDEVGSEDPINPLQILVVRMTVTYIGCLIYFKTRNIENAPFGPKELRWVMSIRGLCGFFAVAGLYYSLINLSVSDVIVIQFLGPTATSLLAYLLLKERFTKVEVIGGLASLGGVLLIAKPPFLFGNSLETDVDNNVETSDPRLRLLGVFGAFIGMISGSGALTAIRYVGHRADPVVLVSYFALIATIASFLTIILVPSLSFKLPQSLKQWTLFGVIGVTGFFMQLLMTSGIQSEKASRAASMMYTQIIFGIAWEFIIWHHLPSLLSWFGITIILISSFCTIYFKPHDESITHAPLDEEEDDYDTSAVTHNEVTINLKDLEVNDD